MPHRKYAAPGSAPATLATLLAPPSASPSKIRLTVYSEGTLIERPILDLNELPDLSNQDRIHWLDIGGLADATLFQTLGEKYHLHPLALEDALHLGQRPKIEPYPDHLFVVAQMLYYDSAKKLTNEQVSFFLLPNLLITIQEEPDTDVFNPIRDRIRTGRGAIRKLRADYLCYALLDSIIDHCFPILESLGDDLEEMEDLVLSKPQPSCIATLHSHKRTLTQLRRFVWPERDILSSLLHDESGIISPQTKLYLRDAYDHSIQIIDLIESYRDTVSGLTEIYISAVGMRTNEIVRVLTVMSSIFIPLTFVAGVYGMNFDHDASPWNMPELHHHYGYPLCGLIMISITVGQIIFFKRKKWI